MASSQPFSHYPDLDAVIPPPNSAQSRSVRHYNYRTIPIPNPEVHANAPARDRLNPRDFRDLDAYHAERRRRRREGLVVEDPSDHPLYDRNQDPRVIIAYNWARSLPPPSYMDPQLTLAAGTLTSTGDYGQAQLMIENVEHQAEQRNLLTAVDEGRQVEQEEHQRQAENLAVAQEELTRRQHDAHRRFHRERRRLAAEREQLELDKTHLAREMEAAGIKPMSPLPPLPEAEGEPFPSFPSFPSRTRNRAYTATPRTPTSAYQTPGPQTPHSRQRSSSRPEQISNFDPMDVLRDHEVPYEPTQRERARSLGPSATRDNRLPSISYATGQEKHSDSKKNNVNSAGFPVPTDKPEYQEMITDVSQTASPAAAQFPPHISASSRNSSRLRQTRSILVNPVQKWRIGAQNFNNGLHERALSDFIEILNAPHCDEIPRAFMHYNMGIVYSRMHNLPQAIAAFEASVNAMPELTVSWYCLGVAAHKQRFLGRAVEAFDTAIGQFAEGVNTIDYRSMGLDLQLMKTVIRFDRDLSVSAFGRYQEVRMYKMEAVFEYMEPARIATVPTKIEEAAGGEKVVSSGKRSLWKKFKRKLSKKHNA